MFKRALALVLLAAALAGCGGGKGPSDTLYTLRVGSKWVYRFAGTVTLPLSKGGGVHSVQEDQSTLTVEVATATAKDADSKDVNILDRRLNLVLLDGRQVKGDLRLYVTQDSDLGIFVHGINNAVGDTIDPANDRFVPGTANPPFKFLYLPNPFSGGTTVSYTDPLGSQGSGGYALEVDVPTRQVQVPAGTFLARSVNITENYSSLTLTAADFAPNAGIIRGTLNVTLSDGTVISGIITLTSLNL